MKNAFFSSHLCKLTIDQINLPDLEVLKLILDSMFAVFDIVKLFQLLLLSHVSSMP